MAPDNSEDDAERTSDDFSTPETAGTVSPERPASTANIESGMESAKQRRAQRQRRMKLAWQKLVESFDDVFYNSDEDDAEAERSLEEDYFRGQDRGAVIPIRGRPPSGPANYDHEVINIVRSLPPSPPGAARDNSVGSAEIEVIPGPPISFVTELYNYSEASRRGEYEEAYLRNSFENPNKPSEVYHARGPDQGATQGLVFKLVSMYAIPHDRKRRRRNRYDSASEGSAGENDYLRHERKLGVLAELGTYMTIHSASVLKALRTIITVHPDLPRMAETITIPEPFCLIVQYKNQLDDYVKTLPNSAAIPATGSVPEQRDKSVPVQPDPLPEDENELARRDLRILLDYVFRSEFGRKYDAELALQHQKKCTFELCWMLFKPGSYVYSWEADSLNCFIVDSFELEGLFAKRTRSSQAEVRPRNRLRGQEFSFSRVPETVVVKMCYLEFDGDYIGRRPKKVVISAFEGEKDINTLPVFPEQYCPDNEKVRQHLIGRGKEYLKLTKRTYAEYDGETLSIPQRSVRSRVMIDSRTFYNDRDSGMTKTPKLKVPKEEGAISSDESPSDVSDDSTTPYRARRSMRTHKRRIRDMRRRPNRNTILTEHDILDPDTWQFTDQQYMLCTQKIYGFILKERTWDLLNVSSVKPPEFKEDMIEDLVLSGEAKILVQALSNSHAIGSSAEPGQSTNHNDTNLAPARWNADFVQNKGEGRIFLLHGKPGVGKTTTAECVAEQSRAPLLSITCGDLGIYPDEVERQLMKWLKLATLWRAVLLLDEADVYLESRISGDLQRNSLVSIFLRALEYYQGLLFLTTNRIGTFDEALISRIHVVLHYPDFTDAQRKQIWQTSFRKLEDERPEIKVGSGVMDYAFEHPDVTKLRWNGREIRNAFNTIVALAEFDAEKRRRSRPGAAADAKAAAVRLERGHLEQVVEMSGKFKEYMRRTKGMTDSKYAHATRVRDGDLIPDERERDRERERERERDRERERRR